MEEKIKDNFRLPIHFCPVKHKLSANLYDDLELLTVHEDVSGTPLYHHAFHPTTQFGRLCTSQLAESYTTDRSFLRDSQKFYKRCGNVVCQPKLTEDLWKVWKGIRQEEGFLEKYQYLEVERLAWLNKSTVFLTILMFYGMISPVLNLLAPILLLILPFIIVRIMRIPLTLESYTSILKRQLENHAIGRMFMDFSSVSLSQKAYIALCFGMYIYNIYQNVLSCIRFYRNTSVINGHFAKLRKYLGHTAMETRKILKTTIDLESFEGFNQHLKSNLERIERVREDIKTIPQGGFSLRAIPHIGKTMQQFYRLYDDKDLEATLLFSFGFNGYLETLEGFTSNIDHGIVNPARFINRKKPRMKMTASFYPAIKGNPIPNNISLSNNMIVTGPNAAGKTTLLKSTIVNLLISQQTGYGFYKKAELTPFDYIHCYLNIPDTSARDSLFQAEARRCKGILDVIEADRDAKHFCIFDELYSGTNPYEAIGSAYSYLRYVSKFSGVRFMITTHFVRLCNLFEKIKGTSNKHMEASVTEKGPTYSYRLKPGISGTRGGVSVLKGLKYPREIIDETRRIIEII